MGRRNGAASFFLTTSPSALSAVSSAASPYHPTHTPHRSSMPASRTVGLEPLIFATTRQGPRDYALAVATADTLIVLRATSLAKHRHSRSRAAPSGPGIARRGLSRRAGVATSGAQRNLWLQSHPLSPRSDGARETAPAARPAPHAQPLERFFEHSLECLVVGAFIKQAHAAHATVEDVEHHTTRRVSSSTGHTTSLSGRTPIIKKRTCPVSSTFLRFVFSSRGLCALLSEHRGPARDRESSVDEQWKVIS